MSTDSSDPDGPLADSAFSWERMYASDARADPTVTRGAAESVGVL